MYLREVSITNLRVLHGTSSYFQEQRPITFKAATLAVGSGLDTAPLVAFISVNTLVFGSDEVAKLVC